MVKSWTISLFAAALLAAGGACAQEASSESASSLQRVTVPWYQSFTQNSDAVDMSGEALSEANEVELSAGQRWDFRFSVDSRRFDHEPEMDGVRAGAFFRITPRVRVGGELGIVSRDGNPLLAGRDEDAPQVKVESALRF